MRVVATLPGEKEALKISKRHRLNLGAKTVEGQTMDPRQQAAIAPFQFLSVGMKFSAQNKPLRLERQQRGLNLRRRHTVESRQRRGGGRTDHFHSSPHQFT